MKPIQVMNGIDIWSDGCPERRNKAHDALATYGKCTTHQGKAAFNEEQQKFFDRLDMLLCFPQKIPPIYVKNGESVQFGKLQWQSLKILR